ncbi:hypothetical protein PHBOTO_005862, partial [Pseudozyma hubeiensis]
PRFTSLPSIKPAILHLLPTHLPYTPDQSSVSQAPQATTNYGLVSLHIQVFRRRTNAGRSTFLDHHQPGRRRSTTRISHLFLRCCCSTITQLPPSIVQRRCNSGLISSRSRSQSISCGKKNERAGQQRRSIARQVEPTAEQSKGLKSAVCQGRRAAESRLGLEHVDANNQYIPLTNHDTDLHSQHAKMNCKYQAVFFRCHIVEE